MALLLLLVLLATDSTNGAPPNIIFFMADQQRQDSIGSYPGSVAITPNIDSIASDGILFTNSWTSTPSCTPARAAILTGRSPWGHGMLGYGAIGQLYPYELIHPMNDIGYQTASIGKNHFGFLTGFQWSPVTHGYQYYKLYDGLGNGMSPYNPYLFKENHDYDYDNNNNNYDYNSEYFWITDKLNSDNVNCTASTYDDYDQWFQSELPGQDPEISGKPLLDWNSWRGAPFAYHQKIHPTEWVANEAIDYLENIVNHKKPFFLKISFHRPHSPYDPPQEYINFVKDNYDLNNITSILHGNRWDTRFAVNNQYCGSTHKDAWCGWMNMTDTNTSRISYFANVYFIDVMVGKILNKLKELKLYNSSYILWTSDHGDQLGDHNLWRKTYPYNSNAKVPMIIKWPNNQTQTSFNIKDIKIKRGTINNKNIIELRDILPTIHNVSGIQLPLNWSTEWSGLNINDILYNNTNANNWRDILDLEHSTCYNETNHWNALTDGITYKYIYNAFFGNESLFNLQNDPNEMNDVSKEDIITLIEWRNKLIDMFEKQNRGSDWVQNGRLQIRPDGQTYGANYPYNQAPCQ